MQRVLAERAGRWRDLNVPPQDGQIGTSTGHSGIWIAWALSKTGGTLITVELDATRHKEALANFEAAGLSAFVEARLGSAHDIVPALEGPFDFVCSDADKDWYPHYFTAVYLALLRRTPGAETTVDERGGGLAMTFKRGS